MRFYILSDLHLRAEVQKHSVSDCLKKICAKIRTATSPNETILFIILGDLANKGDPLSFNTASNNFLLIKNELKDYNVKFEFVPGNHDLENGSLHLFSQLTSTFGSAHSYEMSSVYSNIYEGVNFIFADSTLSREPDAPGRVDIEAIGANVNRNLTNVLFCHHALSQGHGGPHDTIEDVPTVRAKLENMGIDYLFHGHVHDANITMPTKGLIEIGCGSLGGDIYWFSSVFHQFLVGYLQDNKIVRVERWIDTEDGHGGFAVDELYPKPQSFADPDSIGRITYDPVAGYITRYVAPYGDVIRNSLECLLEDKRTLLLDVVKIHRKVLLLCDAGIGKSIELKNLASILSNKYHTLLYSLENYTGQDIQELLPDSYRRLSPNHVVLLLDGYDELDNRLSDTFKRKLKLYVQTAVDISIVISSRSNFCGNENSNESSTFPGFYVYALEKLCDAEIRKYLEERRINAEQFWRCTYVKGVSDLIYNPFYLTRLSAIYNKENDLPPRSELMEKLITDAFNIDELKFSGNLGERYYELFNALETLAIALQLMHQQSFDDREEYQALLSFSDRELIKKSGLLNRKGDKWMFLHNNFREYLAARYLAHLPKDEAVSIFYDGSNIKPSWVNTLGYLVSISLDWNLVDWLAENAPAALVKFESDRLQPHLRAKVFKLIFEKYESQGLHFNDDLCDEIELAHFANSNEILVYLLDRISNPQHYVSQYTAVNILGYFPSLFGKNSNVREILLKCCEQYPATDKTTCRLAMVALYQLELQTPDTTRRLMEKFKEVDEDFIRLGMYEYLLGTREQNAYAEYCLSGIKLIAYRLNTETTRIANEEMALINCLKSMSTVDSVTLVLKWFSREHNYEFYDADKVLMSAIESATKLYKAGHTELFDTVVSCYIDAARELARDVTNSMTKFFVATGTLYSAAAFAAVQFEDEPLRIFDLVNCDSTVIESLKAAYLEGRLESHRAFQQIVICYVKDETKYTEYADLIRSIDKIDLPEYKEYIDYNALHQKSAQDYFDILFSKEKREKLTLKLLDVVNNPDVTTKQLLDADFQGDVYSVLCHLRTAMYQFEIDIRVSEFFDKVNINEFILWSSSKLLYGSVTVVPNQAQREKLIEIVAQILKTVSFANNVIYHSDTIFMAPLTFELVSVIRYLDYPLDEATLLDMTELPAFVFERYNKDQTKYSYLLSKLPTGKLKQRLIQNVASQKVKGMVLKDHIEFFDKFKDSSLAEYVAKVCDDQSDTSLRSSAWRYLYNTFGKEYVVDELLPVADEELLIEISNTCKDIPKIKLCEAMEREYKNRRSLELQARLILLGDRTAIEDYASEVSKDKRPPEGLGVHGDGSTEAIGLIRNPVFLPQLEELLVAVLDPEFEDCSWRGLRGSLIDAYINCAVTECEGTIEILKKHRPSMDKDEKNFRYCNYIIERIVQAEKSALDKPNTFAEMKAILCAMKARH